MIPLWASLSLKINMGVTLSLNINNDPFIGVTLSLKINNDQWA